MERNPEPDFEQALDNLYIRINLRLSQTERQFILLAIELRDLNVRFGSIERRFDFIEQKIMCYYRYDGNSGNEIRGQDRALRALFQTRESDHERCRRRQK